MTSLLSKADRERLLESIKHWENLASEADRMAEHEERVGICATGVRSTSRNKADLYRRTAESLRLQLTDGAVRCVCHLIPITECATKAAKNSGR